MKKLKYLVFIGFLVLTCGVAFADLQTDSGQSLSVAPVTFQKVRYGRTGAIATSGGHDLSKDMVVVWDSTSDDGVSVKTSTTSNDRLVAGILLDNISGSSSDNTALKDESQPNWGRVQSAGFHANAKTDGRGTIVAGQTVCTSAVTAGTLSNCFTAAVASSDDLVSVGVALTNESSSKVDIIIRL